jgi:nitrogen regulatory protein P-II 1
MLKIEAVIQPWKLDETRTALEALDVHELTVSEVSDHGAAAKTSVYRGAEYRTAVARIKLEMLVADDDVDAIIAGLMRAARTDARGDGDGRIFIYQVADAIKIHSGEYLRHQLT